jgi:dolichol kinase
VFIGIVFTLGSWLIGNIEKYNTYRFIVGCIIEIITLYEIFYFNKKIKLKIIKLEEEE